MSFFLEVLAGGALSGVMYALVAIGFVLIYRASGVFNFAQGSMILFAALTFVNLVERGAPKWAAFAATFLLLVMAATLIQRLVLKPLANRSVITLFLATLGLSYMFEGLAQIAWGADVHALELGLSDQPLDLAGLSVSSFDLAAWFRPRRYTGSHRWPPCRPLSRDIPRRRRFLRSRQDPYRGVFGD